MGYKDRNLKFEYLEPDERVRDLVVGYFNADDQSSLDDPMEDKTFPSFSVSLVFQLGDRMTATSSTAVFNEDLNQYYILGPNKSPIFLRHTSGVIDTFLVRFHVGAFYFLFGIPGNKLVDDILDFNLIDKLGGHYRQELIDLANMLFEAESIYERKRIMDFFLRDIRRRAVRNERYRNYEEDRVRLRYAFDLLKKNNGKIKSVGHFADSLNLGPRTLNRLTERYTGSTLKQISKYCIMMNLVQYLGKNQDMDLKAADIISLEEFHNSNYHLSKDLKSYTGERSIADYLTKKFDVAEMFYGLGYSTF